MVSHASYSWEAKSPCQPLSTFLKLPVANKNPDQWPKLSDLLYLSLLLSPVQQNPLLWGTALLKKWLNTEKNPTVPSHSSPKCIRVLTCLSKTHSGEADSPVHPRMRQQAWGIARCSEKARSLRWNLVHRDQVCLPQEAATPACNRVGLRFLWVISKQYCPSFQQVLQVLARAVLRGAAALWAVSAQEKGRQALGSTQLSTVKPPDRQWTVKAHTRTFLPKHPNCLNNFHSVNKEQQCSSKAQDEFATGGFLCFANNLLNEPTRLTTSNLGFKYSIYSWQQLCYVLKELLQQILVPVVILKSNSLKCCHGMITMFLISCKSFKCLHSFEIQEDLTTAHSTQAWPKYWQKSYSILQINFLLQSAFKAHC